MAQCEHYQVCERDALDGHDGKCILHSENPDKDSEAFLEALEKHQQHGLDFRWMVFPGEIDFREQTLKEKSYFDDAIFKDRALFMGTNFQKTASFRRATFEGEVFFMDADFEQKADFWKTTFKKNVDFSNSSFEEKNTRGRHISNFESADFLGETVFDGSIFKCGANFSEVNFWDEARFKNAVFEGDSSFWHVTFDGWTCFLHSNFAQWTSFEFAHFTKASFVNTTFERGVSFECAFRNGNQIQFESVNFTGCEFGGNGLFAGDEHGDQIFANGDVKFRDVTLEEDASLHFRYADLSNCQFLRTDLRNAEFTGVKWREEVSSDGWLFEEWFSRIGLYDEVHEQNQDQEDESSERDNSETDIPPWSEIERLYRQLKRNYEERGDFPRGGDFHIGEKEARRRNPETRWGPWFLLTVYRALSKYGERALPATFWLLGLVPALALFYFLLGASTCTLCGSVSYSEALLSSMEATFYPVRPVEFQGFWPQLLSIIQRVASPIIITLLALALRQRVKR